MLKRVSIFRVRIWSSLNQRGLFSFVSTRKTHPTSERDLPLPPKKPFNAYASYVRERYKQPGDKLSMAIIAREWREMDPRSFQRILLKKTNVSTFLALMPTRGKKRMHIIF